MNEEYSTDVTQVSCRKTLADSVSVQHFAWALKLKIAKSLVNLELRR